MLNGSATANAFAATRAPTPAPWYITACPMNGPELTVDAAGRALIAMMSDDDNHVYWAVLDAAAPGGPTFAGPFPTPGHEANERYATAVANAAGDVLLVWNVGPMAVSGTAQVKYALYTLTGAPAGPSTTVGTSFAGTKATAFVGADGGFYIVTTAL